MAADTTPLSITSLRGGYDDETPPHLLDPDQMQRAFNVEIFHSALGERRQGMEALDLTDSGLSGETGIVFLGEFFPTGVINNPALWAVAVTPSTSVSVAYRNTGSWTTVSPDDAITTTAPNIYAIMAQILAAKYFFAYASGVDRLHVWDGTHLRPTGLTAPAAAPTGANEGVGAFVDTRYYRVREIIKSGSTVQVRSEPSAVLTFSPSGTGAGVTVTKPTTANTRSTHWELEASQDGPSGNFYLIATTAIGTTTYNDENASGTYTSFTLSDAVGAYLLQPSAKFLAVDDDRLLWFSHFTDDTKRSQFGWSPVGSDPGVGNDERFPIVTTGGTPIVSYRNIDPTVGGEGTGISNATNGVGYLFKWNRTYRYQRTLDVTNAYEVNIISTDIGAIPGSVVNGVDELGRACCYFIDPQTGPWRIGQFGLQRIRGLRTTWRRANTFATKVIARGVYYPDKQQIIWVFAADTVDSPTFGIRLQITEVQSQGALARRGWTVFDGAIANAYALCTLHELVTGDPTSLSKSLRARPFGGYLGPTFIQRWDTGTTDNGTAFTAWIRTKPFFLGGLLQKWGGAYASLLAVSNGAFTVLVNLLVDFGRDTSNVPVTTNLLPETSEPVVIKDLDALVAAEARSLTIEFKDP